jgi:hypothetical protein
MRINPAYLAAQGWVRISYKFSTYVAKNHQTPYYARLLAMKQETNSNKSMR